MDVLKTVGILVILFSILGGVLYWSWNLTVKRTTARSKKIDDTALLKAYKGTGTGAQWGMAVVGFLFCAGLIGGVFFYYMYKKMNRIYRDELLMRNVPIENV